MVTPSRKSAKDYVTCPTKEQGDAQIAKHRATAVHTVFRVGGEIIAILGHERRITSRGHVPMVDMDGGHDKIAERLEDKLSKIYSGLEVHHYSKKEAMTYGAATDEMFRRGPRISDPNLANSGVNSWSSNTSSLAATSRHASFNADALKIFQEAMERYGFR